MAEQPTFNRRRVLELSGVGTGLAVAGCMDQLDDPDPLSGDRGDLAEGERRVTMLVQPDQEELEQREDEIEQEVQQEIQEEVEADELTEQEAQIEFQTRIQAEIQAAQRQLIEEAFETIPTEFEQFDLTIEDTLNVGAMLVAGPASDLIDAIDIESIQAILGREQFEQAQQAQEQQQQQPAPTDGE